MDTFLKTIMHLFRTTMQLYTEPDQTSDTWPKIVSDKILDVPKMWQNERLQPKNDYKCCRMITNTLGMIIITK
jgi:hypothetical protein